MPLSNQLRTNLTARLGVMLGALFLVSLGAWTGLLLFAGCAVPLQPAVLLGAAGIAAVTLLPMVLLIKHFVTRPIRRLVHATRLLAQGEPIRKLAADAPDDIGRLGTALLQISQVLDNRKTAIHQEHSEFLNLFESVPCLITVQDRNLRLIRYNREFAEKFAPRDGDYCYSAYKGAQKNAITARSKRPFRTAGPTLSRNRDTTAMAGPSAGWPARRPFATNTETWWPPWR
jgi:HAMP domain-containing protein